MLKFYSASNGIVDSSKAIEEAILKSFPEGNSSSCDLLVIHCTVGHSFQTILNKAKSLCPEAEIVGCTCAGVIGNEGANESMKAVAVMGVIADNKNHLQVSYCEHIDGQNSFEAGQQLAKDLKDKNPNINIIQILASGIDISADKTLQGIETIIGPDVKVFGGTSSDNMKAITSFQFYNDKVMERGAVCVGFGDPNLEVIMGVHHGSVQVGPSFKVTKAERNKIYEIEGQKAWPYLMDRLKMPHDTHPGPCIPISGLGEPLSQNLHGEYNNPIILRAVLKVDDDGGFYLPTDCKEGTELCLTQRDEDLIFSGMEVLMGQFEGEIKDKKVAAVFHTDCAARGRATFDKISKEEIISMMQDPISYGDDVPWLGMYGFGEFTLLNNKNYFHNYTSSIYILAYPE